jgi:hypothetical protein
MYRVSDNDVENYETMMMTVLEIRFATFGRSCAFDFHLAGNENG